MNRLSVLGLTATVSVAILLACEPDAGRAEAPQRPRPEPVAAEVAEPLDYVERCLGAPCESALPTLIAIHGLGDTPESFVAVYDGLSVPVRVLALRAPIPWGEGFAWFPYRTRTSSPAMIAGALRDLVPRVLATIDRVCATRSCVGLPVVSGFSQGGMTSFTLAALAPTRLRAAFPVSGFLPESLEPSAASIRPPIVAFHGGADDVVSVDLDRAGVERLRTAGYEVTLRIEPEVRHTIPPFVRDALLRAIDAALAR